MRTCNRACAARAVRCKMLQRLLSSQQALAWDALTVECLLRHDLRREPSDNDLSGAAIAAIVVAVVAVITLLGADRHARA